MAEAPITGDAEEPLDGWELGDNPCEYFVLDDQLNDEQYIYIELYHARYFTEDWLRALMTTLREFPGWGVGLRAFEAGYILVFADRLMVTGPNFEQCTDIACVVRMGQANMLRVEF